MTGKRKVFSDGAVVKCLFVVNRTKIGMIKNQTIIMEKKIALNFIVLMGNGTICRALIN